MRIKLARVKRGLTQQGLAFLLGFSDQSAISLYERGKREIPASLLKPLAKALNCTVDYLLGCDIIK